MADEIYYPLIKDMQWSFSRVESFDDCPFRWYMKYIMHYKSKDKFYATYGSFIHKIIECYYKGIIKQEEMVDMFLNNFAESVKGRRPKKELVEKYINSGAEYFRNFKPFPFETIGVEKEVKFSIDGIPFIGYIDYLGIKDGELYVVDNKSRDLKQRSGRSKPTANDKQIDTMLRQLYLYSTAVKDEYGKFPVELCFNCFRSGEFIREPFRKEAYDEAVKWTIDKVHEIEREEKFEPRYDMFSCRWICGVSNRCPMFEAVSDGKNKIW